LLDLDAEEAGPVDDRLDEPALADRIADAGEPVRTLL